MKLNFKLVHFSVFDCGLHTSVSLVQMIIFLLSPERLLILYLYAYHHAGIDWSFAPEVHITMEMGGFSPVGITEVPPISAEAEELSGLPINRMGPRILHVVRKEQCNTV